MEKQLPFTGILSNKPEENPGICHLYLCNKTKFLWFALYIVLMGHAWFFYACQISLTGTESSYVIVMGHHLVATVRMRLVGTSELNNCCLRFIP